jgi:hypothetical protein
VTVAAGFLLAACSTASTGTVYGYVTPLIGPAVGYGKAKYTATVEVESNGRVLASERVATGDEFRFVKPAGNYAFVVLEHHTCATAMPVSFRPGQDIHTNMACTSPDMDAG